MKSVTGLFGHSYSYTSSIVTALLCGWLIVVTKIFEIQILARSIGTNSYDDPTEVILYKHFQNIFRCEAYLTSAIP